MLPTENIFYVGSGWYEGQLFPTKDFDNANVRKRILDLKGQHFKMYLPIQQDGVVIEYPFTFRIMDVNEVKDERRSRPKW